MYTFHSLAGKQKSKIATLRRKFKVKHVFLKFLRNALRWVDADATLMGLRFNYLFYRTQKHGTSTDHRLD